MHYQKDRSQISVPYVQELPGLTEPHLDVYWEPTPYDVVNDMLRLADVRSNDVVYDLGCGDGRIVITAAKQTGARCVGIDLDPKRIAESSANARQRGISDRVSFFRQDLFSADISEATVLTIFLFPDVNLRLRSKLLTEMKPGSRVVSYCHNMETWRPDASIKARRNYLHYWVIPAEFGGRWDGIIESPFSSEPLYLEITQQFQFLAGRATFDDRSLLLDGTAVNGDRFTVKGAAAGEKIVPLELRARTDGEVISGTVEELSPFQKAWKWTARRRP